MRKSLIGCSLLMAVLLPNIGAAQGVYVVPNAYPQVTAANAFWQLRGDPVFHAGTFYYPAGPSVYFDGNVMMRTDTFQGVPIYEDATQLPFTVLYIPIGGNVVRPYERRRNGEVAGSTGSRAPSFPVQVEGEATLDFPPQGVTGFLTPPANEFYSVVIPEATRPIGTVGEIVALLPPSVPSSVPTRVVRRANSPAILQVWVPFNGARWYSAGSVVPYSADRFVEIGQYHGFPVYREKKGRSDEIFVTSVADGPLAPYKKKK
jgi:hypothetical protein